MLLWFSAQKLWIKILLPSMVAVTLLMGSGAFLFALIHSQRAHHAELEKALVDAKSVTEILKKYAETQTQVYKAVTFGLAGLDVEKSSQILAQVLGQQNSLEKSLADWKNTVTDNASQESIGSAIHSSGQYFHWVGEIRDNMDDPVSAAANMVTTEKKFLKMQEFLSMPRAQAESQSEILSQQVRENLDILQFRQTAMTIFVVLLSIGLSLWMLRIIMNGVRLAQEDVSKVTSGDLSHVVRRTTGDEVGQLAESVDTMRRKLHGVIGEVKNSATALSLTSNQIGEMSSNFMKTSHGLQSNIGMIIQAGNAMVERSSEMDRSAQTVAQSAETSNHSLNQLLTTIREISENCSKEADMANATKTTAQNLVDGMAELKVASKEIGSILQMINSVANQTRLLSLNATIEAAAAGEAGKGFAVVASEVKDLAEKSNVAAKQIQEKIHAVQTQSDRQHEAVLHIAGVIDQFANISMIIAAAVEEQAATVQSMSGSMSSVSHSTHQLENGISDVAERSRNVLQAIHDMVSAISQTGPWVQQNADSAKRLLSMSEKLSDKVSGYKV